MIVVDAAVWPWRGRLWAHLASDQELAELHRFAADLGLRRTAFQGDHYDVDAALRDHALERGALAVPSRELVRRLQATGLRRRGDRSSLRWAAVAEVPLGQAASLLPVLRQQLHPRRWVAVESQFADLVARSTDEHGAQGEVGDHDHADALVAVLTRPGELAVVLRSPRVTWPPRSELVVEHPRLGP
ncbi:MAG: DUF4031 domain-containing protein [Acidimicrobiia bacterium]|nr:DUF4031 domain-containing protein [Acidimicrobiia bacterium]